MKKSKMFSQSQVAQACLTGLSLLIAGNALAQSNPIVDNQPVSASKPLTNANNVMIPAAKDLEVGFSHNSTETSGIAAYTMSGEKVGLRLVVDKSKISQHAMIAVGAPIGNANVLGGYSVGTEPINHPGIKDDMDGRSLFGKLEYVQPLDGVRSISLDLLSQRTKSKNVSTTDTPFTEVSSRDVGNYTIRTTTKTGYDRATVDFFGGNLDRIGFKADTNISDNGILGLGVSHTRTRLLDERTRSTQGQINYRHYLPDYRANLQVSADTEGQLRLGLEKNFADNAFGVKLNAYKNTKGAKDSGVFVSLQYAFGAEEGKIVSAGIRPEPVQTQATQEQMLNTLYNPRDYFGKIVKGQQRFTVSETSSDLICLPPAPVVVPPVVVPTVVVPPVEPPAPPACAGVEHPLSYTFSYTTVSQPKLTVSGFNVLRTGLDRTITVTCNATDADGVTGTCTFIQKKVSYTNFSGVATITAAAPVTWPINQTRTFTLDQLAINSRSAAGGVTIVYAKDGFELSMSITPKDGKICADGAVVTPAKLTEAHVFTASRRND